MTLKNLRKCGVSATLPLNRPVAVHEGLSRKIEARDHDIMIIYALTYAYI